MVERDVPDIFILILMRFWLSALVDGHGVPIILILLVGNTVLISHMYIVYYLNWLLCVVFVRAFLSSVVERGVIAILIHVDTYACNS